MLDTEFPSKQLSHDRLHLLADRLGGMPNWYRMTDATAAFLQIYISESHIFWDKIIILTPPENKHKYPE